MAVYRTPKIPAPKMVQTPDLKQIDMKALRKKLKYYSQYAKRVVMFGKWPHQKIVWTGSEFQKIIDGLCVHKLNSFLIESWRGSEICISPVYSAYFTFNGKPLFKTSMRFYAGKCPRQDTDTFINGGFDGHGVHQPNVLNIKPFY